MIAFEHPDVALPATADDDPRVGALLGRAVRGDVAPRAVLVGFPSDEGVRRNGGRPGAARGPARIRRALFRMTPDPRCHDAFVDLLAHTEDLGDLALGASLVDDQERLGQALAPYLRQGTVPVVLGGGHETAFGHFLGYVYAGRAVSIVNCDAHADVRPLDDGRPHSGSPFRQALQHISGACKGYVVAGLQPASTARAHLDFLDAHGGRYLWCRDLTAARAEALYLGVSTATMSTFDLDAVDQAMAPGVSAPAPAGLAADVWLAAAYHAGRAPQVASMDVVELNPTYDVDGRTERLAALTVWHFLRGLAARKADTPNANTHRNRK